MPNWQDISDEELLAELHSRFGDSWCSFSSGVRARGECPVCKLDVKLTRHHLVPTAVGAGRNLEVKRRYVKLCGPCHQLAHRRWGPGNRYVGPQDREIFLKELLMAHREENGSDCPPEPDSCRLDQ